MSFAFEIQLLNAVGCAEGVSRLQGNTAVLQRGTYAAMDIAFGDLASAEKCSSHNSSHRA